MDLTGEIFWFFLGAIGAVFLTRLLSITHAALLVSNTINDSLLMLSKVHEDVAFIRELKAKHMREVGMDHSQIKKFEKIDAHILGNWKETVIQNMISNCPLAFRKIMKFNNWKEAMQYLDSMYKKQ